MTIFSAIKQILGISDKTTSPTKSDIKFDKLIVALGNPGDRYGRTRHNVGWIAADKFSENEKALPLEKTDEYAAAYAKIGECNVIIAYPLTYMNLSGKAVKTIIDKYSIEVENITAIMDEYNFPVGKVHLKRGGSDGGHNGTASLIEELGSTEFARLRCGIGKRFGPGGLVDYVLSEFEPEETDNLNIMICSAAIALKRICETNFSRAMSEINSGKLFSNDPET